MPGSSRESNQLRALTMKNLATASVLICLCGTALSGQTREDAVMETLSQTPPELAADIYNTGVYLAGGGSMLRGLDKRLSIKTDLPVYIAEDPLRAVVRGTGITLKNIGKFKGVLIK